VEPWWLTSHFAERSLMPRRYKCAASATCHLTELTALLPSLQHSGYTVVNIDWPVHAGPDALYEGFGIYNATAVDPLLGTDDEWAAFADEVHRRGMRLVSDFNPSYFWTGAPAWVQAVADVKAHGLHGLPASSPARWFRWNATCAGAKEAPPDDQPEDGMTDTWVHSAAAGACYWSVFGGSNTYGGQPTADFASPEWQTEVRRILRHWAVERHLDGIVLDAPFWYLVSNATSPHDGRHDQVVATTVREVIVEPMHALGVAVWGEVYNLQRPTIAKMLDGGRNTDMPNITSTGRHPALSSRTKGFPSHVHDMVLAQNTSALEQLLRTTVDVWNAWTGSARTEPHSSGPPAVAGLKAAVTALLAGYYVVRAGPECSSPHGSGYGRIIPGDEWPGGCFGEWAGAKLVAPTLKALTSTPALTPRAARAVVSVLDVAGAGAAGVTSVYAALRSRGNSRAVVLFNFATAAVNATLEPLGRFGVMAHQTTDLIGGGRGPAVDPSEPWVVALKPRGWAAYGV